VLAKSVRLDAKLPIVQIPANRSTHC
jgi:hypothetical protein